ncbi:MAG: YrzE family protein [Bacillota bacterium]|nr:YrzE family protein [Bacillota bacterium]
MVRIKTILIGIGTALTITIVGLIFISGWIIIDQGTNYYLPTFGLLLGIISCILGGHYIGKELSHGKWWHDGLLLSFGYLFITYLIVSMMFPVALNWDQISSGLIISLAGILGTATGYLYKRTIAFRWKHRERKIFDKKGQIN